MTTNIHIFSSDEYDQGKLSTGKNVLKNWSSSLTSPSSVCCGCWGSGGAVGNNVKCILSCCYSREWNGGMMPFITIISFAKWDPLLSSHTYLGPIPEPRQRQQSCDWNMMQVSAHGCGGATSSDQSVVRGCVVTWKQHTHYAISPKKWNKLCFCV